VEFPGHNGSLGIGGGTDAINNISHGIHTNHTEDWEQWYYCIGWSTGSPNAGSNPALCHQKNLRRTKMDKILGGIGWIILALIFLWILYCTLPALWVTMEDATQIWKEILH